MLAHLLSCHVAQHKDLLGDVMLLGLLASKTVSPFCINYHNKMNQRTLSPAMPALHLSVLFVKLNSEALGL